MLDFLILFLGLFGLVSIISGFASLEKGETMGGALILLGGMFGYGLSLLFVTITRQKI